MARVPTEQSGSAPGGATRPRRLQCGLWGGVLATALLLLPATVGAQRDAGAVADAGALAGPSADEPSIAPVRGPPELPYEEDEGFGAQFLKTLLALGIVILLTYLVLNVGLRRLMGMQGVRPAGGGLVRVIERHPLEAKKTLYVVRVGELYLLLGAGEQGLSLLRELDGDSIDKALAEAASAGPPGGALLQKLLNRRNKEP